MGETRIQLCGSLVARVDGTRVDAQLPGRQGRLLFAYLVHERRRESPRDRLASVLWGDDAPYATETALSALLSKLRRVVGLSGRSSLRLVLPPDAWVDIEVAREALHRAESAVQREDWGAAWGPARVAQHVGERGFLTGETATWAVERREEVAALLVRSLELAGLAALRVGGGEHATAQRTAQRLVELAPLHESGTRLLMEVHAAAGNRAEALLAYERLRTRLRDELGVAPAPQTQALHRALLG